MERIIKVHEKLASKFYKISRFFAKMSKYHKAMREDKKNENKPKVYGCIGMFVL